MSHGLNSERIHRNLLRRASILKAEEVPMCEANPLRNVFSSVDGAVAPCVYLRIPKKGNISRIFMDKEYEIPLLRCLRCFSDPQV